MQLLASHKFALSKDYQRARTWILVIHYGFEEDARMKRDGNQHDLTKLRRIFSEYQDCTYKEIDSPLDTEIPEILSDTGIKNNFAPFSDEPTLFLLFILSHGDENGKIYTDSGSFTTFQVWEALRNNKILENALKINFFGPCRGNLNEIIAPPPAKKTKQEVGENSMRVLHSPNKQNFINFFSTVESTKANTVKTEGTCMVRAFCNTLVSLKQDVDVTEFLRQMEQEITNFSALEHVQTPQFAAFPHTRTLFHKRQGGNGTIFGNDAKREIGPLITAERSEFYPWLSKANLIFKKGHALIFSSNENQQSVCDLAESLKFLEFQPESKKLSQLEETLHSVALNDQSDEGCLFVVVFAPIKKLGIENSGTYELAVDLGSGNFVPIGQLTRKFIITESLSFIAKPKVFIFLDSNAQSDSHFPQQPYACEQNRSVTGNNHNGFLISIFTGRDSAKQLIAGLKSPRLVEGKVSLQEALTEVLCDSTDSFPQAAQLWSTMPLKLDFPKCKDIYIPHRFITGGRISYFPNFVQTLISCKNQVVLIHAPPGTGKSRASEEILGQMVVSMSSHFVVHLKLSRMNAYWTEHNRPTVETFLEKCVENNRKEELFCRLADGKVFIILDGFDEICPDLRKEVLKMLKMLIARKVHLLVTSRPQEKDYIISSMAKSVKLEDYELAEFLPKEKVLMLQTRLNLAKEKCELILKKFDGGIKGFTGNPLHLQMICDIYSGDETKFNDIYSIYEGFLEKKVEHGLLTCRQINKNSLGYRRYKNKTFKVLSKCAATLVMEKREILSQLESKEILSINLSGVATIVDERSPLHLVHRTFAEYLTARHFLKTCFGQSDDEDVDDSILLDVVKLFSDGVSNQTLKFIDSGINHFLDVAMVDEEFPILEPLKKSRKSIFDLICKIGLPNIYSFLLGKIFSVGEVAEWLRLREEGRYFQACLSSVELAAQLANLCPQFQVENVQTVVEALTKTNGSRPALQALLSKVEDWKSVWPRAKHVFDYLKHGAPLSVEQFAFVLENCPGLDGEGLVQMFYDRENFNGYCRVDLLPFLLDHGLNLTAEKNGLKLLNMFYGCSRGVLCLLEHATKIAEHFKSSDISDTKKSEILRKTIGAKSPQDLGLECRKEDDHRKYLEHIADRLSGIVDGGRCQLSYALAMTDERQVVLEKCYEAGGSNMQKAWTYFNLYVMRVCVRKEALNLFLEEEQRLPRDFHYFCGCTLAHDAALRGNLMLLRALNEKGFSLSKTNKKGVSPLHIAVQNHFPSSEYLLKHYLEGHFVSSEGNVSPRTEQQQAAIEAALNLKDSEGRTPLHSVSVQETAELLVRNLLGELFISVEGKRIGAGSPRTEEQQRRVVEILSVQDNKGRTPLHCAMQQKQRGRIAILLLRNLLGEYFVGLNCLRQRSGVENTFAGGILMAQDEEGNSALSLSEKCDDQVKQLVMININF